MNLKKKIELRERNRRERTESRKEREDVGGKQKARMGGRG